MLDANNLKVTFIHATGPKKAAAYFIVYNWPCLGLCRKSCAHHEIGRFLLADKIRLRIISRFSRLFSLCVISFRPGCLDKPAKNGKGEGSPILTNTGGVAQWLVRGSLTGGLSLTCA